MRNRYLSRWWALACCLVIATIVVVADRITKHLAELHLTTGPEPFIPGFLDFHLAYNTGAAWGVMAGARVYFVIVAVVVLAAALVYLLIQRRHQPLLAVALGFFVGGCVGNLIDRVQTGAVTDFIHTLFIEFPIFNLADSSLTISVALLMLLLLLSFVKRPEGLPGSGGQGEGEQGQGERRQNEQGHSAQDQERLRQDQGMRHEFSGKANEDDTA
ncbi:MAG: signal peptidase II [Actinomycetia bacterium]|nr:signal peptidase II [Actinomycetes bacterium]